MKKKFLILNVIITVLVLFSILFQSAHSYEHLVKQFSEKKCEHTHKFKHEITHQHNNLDHCHACGFTFSTFTSTTTCVCSFQSQVVPSKKPFQFSKNTVTSFKGSLFLLRAPPIFIV